MEQSSPPPKRTRVVVCRGQYCNIDRRADRFLKRLQERIDQINSSRDALPIKLETANCMSMCGIGPNMMLFPQAMLFNELDDDEVERVIDEYLSKL